MRPAQGPLLVAAGLVFADATIVTLALPDLLVDLDTGVYGVAAVLAVYTAALGIASLPAARLASASFRSAALALGAFSAASVACAVAPNLATLLAARAVQGVAGAFVLTVAGRALAPRAWLSVAVLGATVGPALGGALTQAFSWRAIFFAQAPVPLLAAALYRRPSAAEVDESGPPARARPLLALGLVSGALTALLFGVVLLLVVGWALRPLSAAAAVTIVPLAALAGSRVQGRAELRAIAGAALVGGGIGALAFLPSDNAVWLIAPEAVAGLGLGLALTPLVEQLLPETTVHRRAVNLTVRHLGVTAALLVLAPLVAHELSASVERAKLRTVAVVLDAEISPAEKLRIAPVLVSTVHADRPLAAVRQDARVARSDVPGSDRPTFDAMFERVETVFVRAASDAFRWAFLVAAALAFAAALVLLPRAPAGVVAVAAGLGIIGAQALAYRLEAPPAVKIADPCSPRKLPKSEGVQGLVQTLALRAVDAAACRLGASREELLLAVTDDAQAKRFERRHGFKPPSLRALIGLVT